jgi:hypothetical protein
MGIVHRWLMFLKARYISLKAKPVLPQLKRSGGGSGEWAKSPLHHVDNYSVVFIFNV